MPVMVALKLFPTHPEEAGKLSNYNSKVAMEIHIQLSGSIHIN